MSGLSDIQKKLQSFPNTRILAVSKLQSVEKIRALYSEGQRLFAENYVQEVVQKISELSDLKIQWHFIGHLQKNKVKQVVGHVELIHSVDSLELAKAIHRVCESKNLVQKVLIQVNVAGEESKGGFSEESLISSFDELLSLKNVSITGLMTMPPLSDDPEKVRPYFAALRKLRDDIRKKYPQIDSNFKELSMGTSGDFLVAAEEDATFVRLGTVLFGERPRKN